MLALGVSCFGGVDITMAISDVEGLTEPLLIPEESVGLGRESGMKIVDTTTGVDVGGVVERGRGVSAVAEGRAGGACWRSYRKVS